MVPLRWVDRTVFPAAMLHGGPSFQTSISETGKITMLLTCHLGTGFGIKEKWKEMASRVSVFLVARFTRD